MTDNNSDSEGNFSKFLFDELLRERRKERFWKNIRMALVVAMFMLVFAFRMSYTPGFGPSEEFEQDPYVAAVNISGMIVPENPLASNDGLREALSEAFRDEKAEGVLIRVSSPGGTPVQSELIRARIERLKKEHDKRVVVVGEEMLTSGAYLASMSADKIYAQPATIVGSIGVRMSSFGASELIDKIGVERRIYTAGESKVSLDPFLPEKQSDIRHAQAILENMHQQFIDAVKSGRQDKLKASDEELFSGRYWTGNQALDMGLVDGTETVATALLDEFGTKRVRDYGPRENLLTKMGLLVKSAADILAGHSSTTSVQSTWSP